MASPFARFRKHQKQYLAVFGVVIIIAFVVGSAGTSYLTCGEQRPGEETAVEVGNDEISFNELEGLRESKRAATRFLLHFTGQGFGDTDRLPSPEVVMDSYIRAEKARDLGFVITDEHVSEFIRSLPGPPSRDDIRQFLSSWGYSERQLYDALTTELLEQSLMQTIFSAAIYDTISPVQRWEFHEQMHRRTKVQAYPVEVKEFLAQVDERMQSNPPTEAELAELFQKYKNELANPKSPEFGFKFPHKAAFEYVSANHAALVAIEKERVTTEEIERRYNDDIKKNPAAYPYIEQVRLPEMEGDPQQEPLDAPAVEEASGPTEEVVPLPPLDDAPDETSGNEEAPGTPGEGSDPTKDSPEGAAISPSADALSIPVSYQDEEQPAEPADKADPPADASDEKDPMTDTDPKEDTDPEEGTEPKEDVAPKLPGPPEGPDTPPDFTGSPPLDQKSFDELAFELRIPDDITKGDKPKHDPLWKVEDEIRKTIALERADKDVEELFAPIENAMERYYNRLKSWQVQQKGEQPAAPDIPELVESSLGQFAQKKVLDLAALKAKEVLSAKPLTPQLTSEEIAKQFDLGKAEVLIGENAARFDRFNYGGANRDGARTGASVPYRTAVAKEADNRYLFWKVEESQEKVPESIDAVREIHLNRESVREQVLAAWKILQARELAQNRADEIAEDVRKSGKLLKDVDAYAMQVVEPEPFVWKGGAGFDQNTFRRVFGFNTFEVDGLEDIGEDVLKTVHELDAQTHAVGVAMNTPKSIAYVLQAAEREYVTRDENTEGDRVVPLLLYQTQFLTTPLNRYGPLPQQAGSAIQQQWMEELRREYGLKILMEDSGQAEG